MGKTLVAYFSASGVTKRLAENLAAAVDGDLYEIEPQTVYTKVDLDWTDKKSRSTIEMTDKAFRPAIAPDSHVDHMEAYETVYIGFPIWWYTAPTIVNTFLEQYDLAGKTVIPFATSGSSGMGKTNDDLAPSCKGAVLKEGKRFPANASVDQLKSWALSL